MALLQRAHWSCSLVQSAQRCSRDREESALERGKHYDLGRNWLRIQVTARHLPQHVVDGEVRQFRLNAKSYTKRCLGTVVGDLQGKLLQQDGARSHAAASTTNYELRRGIKLLEACPAYSPDPNAIERIWKELHGRVDQRCPLTMEELTEVAKDEWRKLPQALIDAHCAHFPRQLRYLRGL